MLNVRSLMIAACAAVVAIGAFAPEVKAEYPEKKITFVIPFGAGGGTDRWGRTMAVEAEKHFGQPWQPANVTGAQGVNGWKHMLEQPADGYTLLMGSGSVNLSLALNPTPLVQDDQIKIISIISAFQSVMLAKPGQPWSDWEGFKKYATENPGKLTLGGSLGNLVSFASLMDQAGLKIRLVPYPGAGAATTDFLGGHVDLVGVVAASADKLVPEKAAAVIVASDNPVPTANLKDVPTAKQMGFKGMDTTRWIGVHPDTPDDIADAIASKLETLLADPKVKVPLEKSGERVGFTPREESAKMYTEMVADVKKAAKLLK